MPSSHLIFCCPLLFLTPIPTSIRVFSNESTLHIRWPKYWSFSFNIWCKCNFLCTGNVTYRASLVSWVVKNLPATWETQVRSLGGEDPLEKEMATHSSILAWRIPWTEKLGRPQSMGLQSQTRQLLTMWLIIVVSDLLWCLGLNPAISLSYAYIQLCQMICLFQLICSNVFSLLDFLYVWLDWMVNPPWITFLNPTSAQFSSA